MFATMLADKFIPPTASTQSVVMCNSSALASRTGVSLILTESVYPGATITSVGDSREKSTSLDCELSSHTRNVVATLPVLLM